MMTRASATTKATTPDPGSAVRLQKFLASAGVSSRREAERLIQGGRVAVNGQVIVTLGTRVNPEKDVVRLDGRRLRTEERRVYYLLHKPKGHITTSRDPQGRPTVLDLLRGVKERVFPVGRLDWHSEGLLILTNDGELAYQLTHPSNHIAKVYRVKVKGIVPSAALQAVRRGLYLNGRKSLPAQARRITSRTNSWLEITLYEGQKNQIRRTFDRLGHPVLKLKRVAIGSLSDSKLKPGSFRPLTASEIRRLKRTPS
jgi:pseudouridine synthase